MTSFIPNKTHSQNEIIYKQIAPKIANKSEFQKTNNFSLIY